MTERELQYKLRAISKALQEWNDAEALRLLRSTWPSIVAAVSERPQRQAKAQDPAIQIRNRKQPENSQRRARSRGEILSGTVSMSAARHTPV